MSMLLILDRLRYAVLNTSDLEAHAHHRPMPSAYQGSSRMSGVILSSSLSYAASVVEVKLA